MKNGVSMSFGRMPGAGCLGLLFCEGVAACQSCAEKFSPSTWVGSGLGCQVRWGAGGPWQGHGGDLPGKRCWANSGET